MVLAVSYHSSTIRTIFKEAVNAAIKSNIDLIEATHEDIKLTVNELARFNFDLSENFGDIIARKKDISFKDMQSIHRAFKNFFKIEMAKDIDVINIIVAQASQHAIVHSLSLAAQKFMKQISDATPRDILMNITPDEIIGFEPEEIDRVIFSMEIHLDRIIIS